MTMGRLSESLGGLGSLFGKRCGVMSETGAGRRMGGVESTVFAGVNVGFDPLCLRCSVCVDLSPRSLPSCTGRVLSLCSGVAPVRDGSIRRVGGSVLTNRGPFVSSGSVTPVSARRGSVPSRTRASDCNIGNELFGLTGDGSGFSRGM